MADTDTLVAPDEDVATDLELEEHFKKEVPCDYVDRGCPHPAKWVAHMVGCGHDYTICTPHKARMKALFSTKRIPWVCGESKQEITDITFDEL